MRTKFLEFQNTWEGGGKAAQESLEWDFTEMDLIEIRASYRCGGSWFYETERDDNDDVIILGREN